MTKSQQQEIATSNIAKLTELGYKVNPNLPLLGLPNMRNIEEIKSRIAVINALANIGYEAPTHIIKNWIMSYRLTKYLTTFEQDIIDKPPEHLSEFEIDSMMWLLESLWALLWVANLTSDLDPMSDVGEELNELMPNLEEGQNNDKVLAIESTMEESKIYEMLDYYYRLHWSCINDKQNPSSSTPKLDESRIIERRKALEWVLDKETNWDLIEINFGNFVSNENQK